MLSKRRILAGFCLAAGVAVVGISSTRASAKSASILDQLGVRQGICVVLGDTTGELAVQLTRTSDLTIYSQLPRAEDVEKVRQLADDAGLNGTRIWVEQGDLGHVHLADNLADGLIAVGPAADTPEAEVFRVLRPQAKGLLGSKAIIKPFPDGIDDWSHPYHGPDNNPQSKDRIARAPYLTQFMAEPYFGPVPQVAVASAGRIFKAFGHIAFKRREEPWLNTLVGFNGYNGTMLWKRALTPGIMVHRNTMIATPTTLYVGDDQSCKLIDAATGRLADEIIPPADLAGGTFWKWMALENNVLYALVGEPESKDPVKRWRREPRHGWPWKPLSEGFNAPVNPWGFGRTVLAIDPTTKKILWSHREPKPIDGRAICMKNGRIYAFRFGAFLTCLDVDTGNIVWRKTEENAPALFASLGEDMNRQDWRTNWRTTTYLMCGDQVLYFAGPPVRKLLAVSTRDGSILWHHPYDNFQLVLTDNGLYGIGGGQWTEKVTRQFDPMTGDVLAELAIGRRACTRVTGAMDALLFRANGGSVRLDFASQCPQWISPMRPPCQDGVTIANGLLYWWPWVCDCQLTLCGLISVGPAGNFDFKPAASESQRLETAASQNAQLDNLPESPLDWPTFRANNRATATTAATISAKTDLLWQSPPYVQTPPRLTAPVAAGGLVLVADSHGVVRAMNGATGDERWKVYTGGAIRIPPTIWKGRAFVGSGDGWVYALEAQTGRRLWRFRAAPSERKIPIFGSLQSTWPAASGVLVEDGIAYLAAGIVNYDGTYVYALDAATGRIQWQNNTSGHLDAHARTGVSVQGHMLLHDGKLYLAGGNAVSPAVYDIIDGRCLNDPAQLQRCESISPRGWELFLIGNRVVACGQPFYVPTKYPVFDRTVTQKMLHASTGERDIIWIDNNKLTCFTPIDKQRLNDCVALPGPRKQSRHILKPWGKLDLDDKPLWEFDYAESVAVAVSRNAVVVAKPSELVALDIETGKPLWTQSLPASVVPWGLAIDRDGRVVVTLEDGRVLCFG